MSCSGSTICICARWRITRIIANAAIVSAQRRSGKREVILSLLDLLDGFDLALRHMGDAPASITEGIDALHRKFLGLLQAQGVTPMRTVGETFDPQFHDAIGLVENEEVPPGRVAEEVQRGYRWGDEVLRPARVRVSG
jgi:molecular chaperone GrpE